MMRPAAGFRGARTAERTMTWWATEGAASRLGHLDKPEKGASPAWFTASSASSYSAASAYGSGLSTRQGTATSTFGADLVPQMGFAIAARPIRRLGQHRPSSEGDGLHGHRPRAGLACRCCPPLPVRA